MMKLMTSVALAAIATGATASTVQRCSDPSVLAFLKADVMRDPFWQNQAEQHPVTIQDAGHLDKYPDIYCEAYARSSGAKAHTTYKVSDDLKVTVVGWGPQTWSWDDDATDPNSGQNLDRSGAGWKDHSHDIPPGIVWAVIGLNVIGWPLIIIGRLIRRGFKVAGKGIALGGEAYVAARVLQATGILPKAKP